MVQTGKMVCRYVTVIKCHEHNPCQASGVSLDFVRPPPLEACKRIHDYNFVPGDW